MFTLITNSCTPAFASSFTWIRTLWEEEFLNTVSIWNKTHKKGENLLRQFSSDLSAVAEATTLLPSRSLQPKDNNDECEHHTTNSLSFGLSPSLLVLNDGALVAEKRFSEIQLLIEDFDHILDTMKSIVFKAKTKARQMNVEECTDQGLYGCCLSFIDVIRFMDGYTMMFEEELAMKEKIIKSLTFDTSIIVLTTQLLAWSTQPFIDEILLAEFERKLKL